MRGKRKKKRENGALPAPTLAQLAVLEKGKRKRKDAPHNSKLSAHMFIYSPFFFFFFFFFLNPRYGLEEEEENKKRPTGFASQDQVKKGGGAYERVFLHCRLTGLTGIDGIHGALDSQGVKT